MERGMEAFAVIGFAVIGLSHLLQPRAWVQFFVFLRSKGESGAFADGFLNLPLGTAIVVFHNVWSGLPVVLTLVGWGLVIKSVIRFCAPRQALRIMARVSMERAWEFQVAGVALLILASVIGYGAFGSYITSY